MMERTFPTVLLVIEIAVLFYVVTVAVQLFQARFGAERLRRWMGGHPVMAALKGIALGFITPFCTFTAVPMLVGLRQARVPAAGYVAFIVAAPVLDPVLFGALTLIAGLETAVIYSAIAFVGAMTLALVAEMINLEQRLPAVASLIEPEPSACESSCGAEDEWRGIRHQLPIAGRAAIRLLRGMAPVLAAGIALSLLIEAIVSPDLTAEIANVNSAFSIPIAAAVGTPMYVSTALFVPLADALSAAGLGIGAIVALTIAGAGANLPEFVILSKLARPRIIATFFVYVFGVAIVGGFLTQTVLG